MTLDRQVVTTSDGYWGDPGGDDGWGGDGCRWLLAGATSPVEPSGRAWGPGRPDVHGAVLFARGAFGPYVTHDVATWDDPFTVALTSDVIAVRRGAAVAIVTYTRFDARRNELRLGPLVASAAARFAAVS